MLVLVRDTVEVACQTGAVQPRYPAADGDCCADAVTAAVICACDSMNCWKNSYVIGDAGAMFEFRTIGMTCTLFYQLTNGAAGRTPATRRIARAGGAIGGSASDCIPPARDVLTPPTDVDANSRFTFASSLTAMMYCACADVARTRTFTRPASRGIPSASTRYTAATRATSICSDARCKATCTRCDGVPRSP